MDPDRQIKFVANRLGEPYLTINGEIVDMTEWVRSVEARLAERGRYLEALAFYAAPKSWDQIDPVRGTVTTSYPANKDRGSRAREALS